MSAKSTDSNRIFTHVFIVLLLVAITWSVFGRTIGYDFVNYDDNDYVYANPHVAAGLSWSGIAWSFTHTVSHNWHPFTILSLMLDGQLFGLPPGGYHFTNVLLHTAAVVLLFLVFSKMTAAIWRSSLLAAIFAVHPLRVESVAWIAQRKDVLSAVFFMLTIAAYVSYVRKPRLNRYLLVCLIFICGLMAKPMVVTLPIVLLLLDYWPLGRIPAEATNKQVAIARKLVIEKIPLFIISAAACVSTLLAQQKGINPIDRLSLAARLNNACVSAIIYIYQFVWPDRLAVFYPHPGNNLPMWQVAVSLALLIGTTICAVALRRGHPHLLVGWLWYGIMLLPVIGIIQVGLQAHADRYTYLPEIGLAAAIIWSVPSALTRPQRWVAWIASTALIMILCWRGAIQTSYWRNSDTLWAHALVITPQNLTARGAHWDALLQQNQPEQVVREAESVIEQHPQDIDAYNGLGAALLKQGRLEEARSNFEKVLEISPNRPRVHYNIATILLQEHHLQEAIQQLQLELQIQPDFAEAHNNLGTALTQDGQLDEAIGHLNKAVELSPTTPKTHYNLAIALLGKGDVDGAITEFRREIDLQPKSADAHSDLGVALSQKGLVREAIEEWQKSLQLQPDNLNAACNLAWVFATSSDPSLRNGRQAVELAQRAVQLSHEQNPRILRLLAAGYAETGQFNEAVETAERALALATAQGNETLAITLQGNLDLFRDNTPLRDIGRSNTSGR